MEKFRTIEEYLLNIGTDLRMCELTDVDISRADLRSVLLPDDEKLFQKVKGKSLCKTKLPNGDYSRYDFTGVNLNGTEFQHDSKLPDTKNLFKDIYNSELYETILPKIDCNNYDFTGVRISKTIFTTDSIFSEDKDMFQKVYNKSLYETKLPLSDYSKFDFKDVCIVGTNFQEMSSLPPKVNFFQIVRDKSVLNTVLPSNVVKNLDIYDLSNVEIDLTKYKINILKLSHIYRKYKDNSKIEFPLMQLSTRRKKTIHIKK